MRRATREYLALVGVMVGELIGEGVGEMVGAKVGDIEGDSDGNMVGDMVGDMVGAAVRNINVGPSSAAASPSSSGLAAYRDLKPRWAEFIVSDNADRATTCGTGTEGGHVPHDLFGPTFGARAKAVAALFSEVDDGDVRAIYLCNFVRAFRCPSPPPHLHPHPQFPNCPNWLQHRSW